MVAELGSRTKLQLTCKSLPAPTPLSLSRETMAGPYAPGFAATRVADAADTVLFRIMAALSFRPEAIVRVIENELLATRSSKEGIE